MKVIKYCNKIKKPVILIENKKEVDKDRKKKFKRALFKRTK